MCPRELAAASAHAVLQSEAQNLYQAGPTSATVTNYFCFFDISMTYCPKELALQIIWIFPRGREIIWIFRGAGDYLGFFEGAGDYLGFFRGAGDYLGFFRGGAAASIVP